MSAAKPLTSETPILDGDVLRHDWEGSPRFYLVRIYPRGRRRVQIHVTLEGDPTAWANGECPDRVGDINQVVLACVTQIEDMRANVWDTEHDNYQREMAADYWRSR